MHTYCHIYSTYTVACHRPGALKVYACASRYIHRPCQLQVPLGDFRAISTRQGGLRTLPCWIIPDRVKYDHGTPNFPKYRGILNPAAIAIAAWPVRRSKSAPAPQQRRPTNKQTPQLWLAAAGCQVGEQLCKSEKRGTLEGRAAMGAVADARRRHCRRRDAAASYGEMRRDAPVQAG